MRQAILHSLACSFSLTISEQERETARTLQPSILPDFSNCSPNPFMHLDVVGHWESVLPVSCQWKEHIGGRGGGGVGGFKLPTSRTL